MAECFVCNTFFSSYKDFFNHFRSHYISDLSYFVCIECNKKTFSSLDTYRKHMKQIHFNIKISAIDSKVPLLGHNNLESNCSTENIPQISENFTDYNFNKLKDSALNLVLSLFSKNNINRKDVFEIINSVKEFVVFEIVNSIKVTVLPFVDVKNQINISDLLFKICNLFNDIDSEYKLLRKLNTLNLTAPIEEVTFSNEIKQIHHRGEIHLTNL